jgi:phosphoribosylformylglycinamidine synthase subunit PurS
VNEFGIEVRITPRQGLLDPQGDAIQGALQSLDFDEVNDVRVGRLVRLRITAATPATARDRADEMCRKLLANPVTEDYEIELENIS